MHPQFQLPEKGQCPICFMDLIPATRGGSDSLPPRTLRMGETARALAEIQTAAVERRNVTRDVHLVGKVAFDETRVASITAWVPGRIDRMFVDYTGVNVRAKDHLVELYSPTLYSAQQELLQAIATAKRLEGSTLEVLRSTSDQTVVSATEKLRLYGLSDEQITDIVERGTPDRHTTIYAPIGGVVVHKNALEGTYVDEGTSLYTIADLSKVWVLFDVYESDLAWLRYGQDIEFEVQAYPGELFHGRIAFIEPLLDDHTRTIKVRLNVDNEDLRLKPDMFVNATARAGLTEHGRVVDEDLAGKWMCPMHPEIVADELTGCSECGMDLVPTKELGFEVTSKAGGSLVIPKTAPLVTGERAVVYVQLPEYEEPTFQGRDIDLGPRAGEWYVVMGGLEEGEVVVTHGAFKLDSELQIRGQASMMNPIFRKPKVVRTPIPDTVRTQLGQAVSAYLELQTRLASDEDSPGSAAALQERLASIDEDELSSKARSVWSEHGRALLAAAEKLAGAEGIEERRVEFSPVTEALIALLERFSYSLEAGDVRVFHCPMAFDDLGANWLQLSEQCANPYFGASMLRCGVEEDVVLRGE